MLESTFAIIKPDAVKLKQSGSIIEIIELNQFIIERMEKIQLTQKQAQDFYAAHVQRSFFQELVDYMVSGPVIILLLKKENAIAQWRDLMGATNPAQANVGTIRRMFGSSIGSNSVHGSDSAEAALTEIAFFFK